MNVTMNTASSYSSTSSTYATKGVSKQESSTSKTSEKAASAPHEDPNPARDPDSVVASSTANSAKTLTKTEKKYDLNQDGALDFTEKAAMLKAQATKADSKATKAAYSVTAYQKQSNSLRNMSKPTSFSLVV